MLFRSRRRVRGPSLTRAPVTSVAASPRAVPSAPRARLLAFGRARRRSSPLFRCFRYQKVRFEHLGQSARILRRGFEHFRLIKISKVRPYGVAGLFRRQRLFRFLKSRAPHFSRFLQSHAPLTNQKSMICWGIYPAPARSWTHEANQFISRENEGARDP